MLRRWKTVCFLATLGFAILMGAATANAGDVKMLPDKVFDVSVTDTSGVQQDIFPPGGEMLFNIRFGLMMSEVKSYPVLVTIIIGEEGSSQETITAYDGRLEEGLWLLTEQVKVKGNWRREVPFKVILKVRVINRTTSGSTSFYSYYIAEGTIKVSY